MPQRAGCDDDQEAGDAGEYGAAEASTMEVAQSLPRIRTGPDEQQRSPFAASAANGPTEAKVTTQRHVRIPES